MVSSASPVNGDTMVTTIVAIGVLTWALSIFTTKGER